jgi:formylglycine-generating enzyme required for sulfatase activity
MVRLNMPVIPVLLPGLGDKPTLPLFLEGNTWVDLRSGMSGSELGRLVWGVTGEKPGAITEAGEIAASEPTGVYVVRTLGMTMRPIPGGTFAMGSPESEPARYDNEGPQHEVTLSPFWMSETVVTNQQYEWFVNATGRQAPEAWSDRRFNDATKPVVAVSWYDAVAFCNELSRSEGLAPCYEIEGEDVQWTSMDGYRLPTEAEWEYACRAGTTTAYSFGDDPAGLGEYAWYDENADDETHPVARKKPNGWDLYDMHGNVWEWVWDSFSSYAPAPILNPAGPSKDDAPIVDTYTVVDGKVQPVKAQARTLRGGSFADWAWDLRSACRFWLEPENRDWGNGFRLVRGARRQP